MRRRQILGTIALVTALAVAGGACSSSGRGADDATGDASATTAPTGDGDGTDGGQRFGDLPSPCGPAPADAELAATGDQGVTADSVAIGYGDDAGFINAPGTGAEMSTAVEAMIDWCNDQGGINGRTVVGTYYDAKITEANNVMTEACSQVFMLVGEGFALDGAAEQTRVGCSLPQVPAYTVTSTVSHGPSSFTPSPNPVDITPAGAAQLLAEQFPEQVKKAAVVYGDFQATIETTQKVQAAFPQFGWNFLPDCEQSYPIAGAVQWAPYVQVLKDCGAEVVYFAGNPQPGFQNFLDAAQQGDFHPIWYTDANFYNSNFAAANTTGNADDVYTRTVFVPFEQAADHPAVQQYVDLVEARGAEPAALGAQATSAFLLWATAADACGVDLTRQCVLDQLAGITSWTGGGLQAEANPGENIPSDCTMVLRMQGTTYVQDAPSEQGQFACDPDTLVELDASVPAVANAALDADRISTQYTAG